MLRASGEPVHTRTGERDYVSTRDVVHGITRERVGGEMTGEMVVIGVIGQKGGGGKTTTCLGLAVAAAQDGKAEAVIDIDQQANSAKWRDRRTAEDVAVIGALQSRIKHTLEVARKHGADFVIIDSPGHNDTAAMETVRAAD